MLIIEFLGIDDLCDRQIMVLDFGDASCIDIEA